MNRSTALLFNEAGVLFGLVQTSLPLAVLPIASALATIPQPLEEAAGVLGASRLAIYREIVLPLAWPGIVTGGSPGVRLQRRRIRRACSCSAASRSPAVAMAIRDQMGTLLDWPLGFGPVGRTGGDRHGRTAGPAVYRFPPRCGSPESWPDPAAFPASRALRLGS